MAMRRSPFLRLGRLLPAALIVAILLVSAHHVAAQELPFVHYTPESDYNPLPSAEVYRVYQSRTGFLWMAVFTSGLVRYDGRTFLTYGRDDGLRDLDVRNMVEDGMGRLWVSSDAGVVVSERPLAAYTAGLPLHFADSLGATPLVAAAVNQNGIAVDGSGGIWVGTLGAGVVRYRLAGPDAVVADTLSTALEGEDVPRTVHAIAARRDGTVWVSLSQGYTLVFADDRATEFRVIAPMASAGDAHLNVLYEDERGDLWAGSSDGRLLRWSADLDAFAPVGEPVGGYVVSIEASRDSVLWVGSEGVGVARFRLPALTPLPPVAVEHGLLSLNLHDILEDREGNLWFAQSGGVSKLRANFAAFTHLTSRVHTSREPILPARTVTTVIEGDEAVDGCWLWVGSLEGGATCVRRDFSSITLGEKNGLRGNEVDALVRDAAGRLWMGTAFGINGLSFSGSTRPLPAPEVERRLNFAGAPLRVAGYRGTSMYSATVRPLPVSERDTSAVEGVWLPGYRSVYGLIDNEWFVFRSASGLPSTGYHVVEVDDAGYVWVGTLDEGLYRSVSPLTRDGLEAMAKTAVPFHLGGRQGVFGYEIQAPIFEPASPEGLVIPLRKIESMVWLAGVLWVGTPQGVLALAGTPLRATTQLTTRDGLGADNAISMAYAPASSSIWVGSNGGLAEIDPAARVVRRLVTNHDGLLDNEAWTRGSVRVGEGGVVYYGSPNGLTIYRPEADRRDVVAPLLAINQVSYVEDEQGNNDINIEYAGLGFYDETRVIFKTRLAGYDAEWSAEKSDTKIRYTNLPAYGRSRQYTFEVLAGDGKGAWTTEPMRYAFTVRPAWWLRWWALIGYAVVLVVGVVALGRFQRKRLIRQERERLEIEKERLRAEAAELQARVLQADVERHQLELEKARALEEAYHHLKATQAQLVQAEKMASLGKLTAGIAHEIKNPLNFVMNFAGLSAEYADELRDYLQKNGGQSVAEARTELSDMAENIQLNARKIKQHGDRVDQIVRSMIEHTQATSAERRVVAVNRFVDEYVTHAHHSLMAEFPEFDLTLERDYDEGVQDLEITPLELSRALVNLLSNAFYAVRDRRATAMADYRPLVRVRTIYREERVDIHIEDNGVGIPAALHQKIFGPFFTTRPAGAGTGLGLSLSFEIVTRGHNGALTVESREGEGATFTMALPYR